MNKNILKNVFEVEIFCNIVNINTVTFDQFNASLLNKKIYYFSKKILLSPNFWIVVYYQIYNFNWM